VEPPPAAAPPRTNFLRRNWVAIGFLAPALIVL
jgi:hypothetical protein